MQQAPVQVTVVEYVNEFFKNYSRRAYGKTLLANAKNGAETLMGMLKLVLTRGGRDELRIALHCFKDQLTGAINSPTSVRQQQVEEVFALLASLVDAAERLRQFSPVKEQLSTAVLEEVRFRLFRIIVGDGFCDDVLLRRRALDLTFNAMMREAAEAERSRARISKLCVPGSVAANGAAAANGMLASAAAGSTGGGAVTSDGGGGKGAGRLRGSLQRKAAALSGPDFSSWEGLWGSLGSMSPKRMLPLLQVIMTDLYLGRMMPGSPGAAALAVATAVAPSAAAGAAVAPPQALPLQLQQQHSHQLLQQQEQEPPQQQRLCSHRSEPSAAPGQLQELMPAAEHSGHSGPPPPQQQQQQQQMAVQANGSIDPAVAATVAAAPVATAAAAAALAGGAALEGVQLPGSCSSGGGAEAAALCPQCKAAASRISVSGSHPAEATTAVNVSSSDGGSTSFASLQAGAEHTGCTAAADPPEVAEQCGDRDQQQALHGAAADSASCSAAVNNAAAAASSPVQQPAAGDAAAAAAASTTAATVTAAAQGATHTGSSACSAAAVAQPPATKPPPPPQQQQQQQQQQQHFGRSSARPAHPIAAGYGATAVNACSTSDANSSGIAGSSTKGCSSAQESKGGGFAGLASRLSGGGGGSNRGSSPGSSGSKWGNLAGGFLGLQSSGSGRLIPRGWVQFGSKAVAAPAPCPDEDAGADAFAVGPPGDAGALQAQHDQVAASVAETPAAAKPGRVSAAAGGADTVAETGQLQDRGSGLSGQGGGDAVSCGFGGEEPDWGAGGSCCVASTAAAAAAAAAPAGHFRVAATAALGS